MPIFPQRATMMATHARLKSHSGPAIFSWQFSHLCGPSIEVTAGGIRDLDYKLNLPCAGSFWDKIDTCEPGRRPMRYFKP